MENLANFPSTQITFSSRSSAKIQKEKSQIQTVLEREEKSSQKKLSDCLRQKKSPDGFSKIKLTYLRKKKRFVNKGDKKKKKSIF